jgi:hypothetical protein
VTPADPDPMDVALDAAYVPELAALASDDADDDPEDDEQ